MAAAFHRRLLPAIAVEGRRHPHRTRPRKQSTHRQLPALGTRPQAFEKGILRRFRRARRYRIQVDVGADRHERFVIENGDTLVASLPKVPLARFATVRYARQRLLEALREPA